MKENITQKNIIIAVVVLGLIVFVVLYNKNKKIAPYTPPANSNNIQNTPDSTASTTTPDTVVAPSKVKLTYDQYLQEGIKYETKGEYSKAIISYQKASLVSPKEYVPYSNAGSAYYNLKKYTEAEEHYLKALELSSNNVSVYTKLYDLYFYGLERNFEQMTAFFKDAVEKTGGDVSIVRLYAFYLENMGKFELALPIWESLLTVEPDNTSYKAKIESLQNKIRG